MYILVQQPKSSLASTPDRGSCSLSNQIVKLALTMALAISKPTWGEPTPLQPLLDIQPRQYVACKASGGILIDGRLDEPSWQRAPWTHAFVDIEADDAAEPPHLETRAKIIWDAEFLYIAADLEEPHLWATLRKRDDLVYHDNDFEVFIDPDGDTHMYYEFEMNVFGTVWDLFLVKPDRDGGPYVSSWDISGMEAAVEVWGTVNEPRDEDEGWFVELAFPWAVLGECANRPVPPRDGDQWRLNLRRVQWPLAVERDGEGYAKIDGGSPQHWVWSPQGIDDMHYPEQWGYVQFSEQLAGAVDEFAVAPEEPARRLLREIYYRQRGFYQQFGNYTDKLDSLGVGHRILRNFLWPPGLQATEHMYEAWLEEVEDLNLDGEISRWTIREDSRIWKSEAAGSAE